MREGAGSGIGDGRRGPVTQRIIDAWCDLVGLDFIAQAKRYVEGIDGETYKGTTMYRFRAKQTPQESLRDEH